MENVLEKAKGYLNITEIYEVVATTEVVRDGKDRFRIEVIKSHKGGTRTYYDVLCWFYEDYYVQPAYPRSGTTDNWKFERTPKEISIPILWKIPWLSESTPESALRRAISFIATGDIA